MCLSSFPLSICPLFLFISSFPLRILQYLSLYILLTSLYPFSSFQPPFLSLSYLSLSILLSSPYPIYLFLSSFSLSFLFISFYIILSSLYPIFLVISSFPLSILFSFFISSFPLSILFSFFISSFPLSILFMSFYPPFLCIKYLSLSILLSSVYIYYSYIFFLLPQPIFIS